MRKRQLLYILFALSLLGIFGLSHISAIAERSPVTTCEQWGFYSSPGEKYYIHPEKIVVKPWVGQHHVYGIFMIPGGYRNDYFLTVTIDGKYVHCGTLKYVGTNFVGINAQSGSYLMQGYLNTRVALKLIAKGKANQLKQPENWKLGYIKSD